MIVAGIGCRKGVSLQEVLAAVESALEPYDLSPDSLSGLATAKLKAGEQAIIEAGNKLRLPVFLVDGPALQLVSLRGLTRSAASLSAAGTPSVSETAALAAAGQKSRLLGPRSVHGSVTCAIAVNGEEP
ncbi:cobalamin biosynthesis protein [Aquamicrobium terrae]|uniref:Cobalt-precorrin 5A hydrolase n=1 Tax=Aquamicrobium terrae TaxID=1324945 RepID=A0ABV2MTB7_9HYPH